MIQTNKSNKLFHMVLTALLFAVIIALQFFGSAIKIGGTSFSFVLLPIVVGSIILGAGTGAFLGAVFGFMTLWAGISGQDFFTATLWHYEPVFTALVCMLKATLAGLVPGLVWNALKGKNKVAAIFLASCAAPIVNTGIFIVGGLLFFGEALTTAGFLGEASLVYFLVIGCAGINFIAEFGVNLIFAPAISRIVQVFSNMFNK